MAYKPVAESINRIVDGGLRAVVECGAAAVKLVLSGVHCVCSAAACNHVCEAELRLVERSAVRLGVGIYGVSFSG